VKDHTPNCATRTIGSPDCTCGAIDETYPVITTNDTTVIDAIVPRNEEPAGEIPTPKVAKTETTDSKAIALIQQELDTFSALDGMGAVVVCKVLQRLLNQLEE
jgi:hypothetical protein